MTDAYVLPIEGIRQRFEERISQGRLVVTAPTGSGKSTQIPRWCASRGRVLVIEPRRVACRGLAVRVAELEGVCLGDAVGYAVRDDNRASPKTAVVFATPGVVLRWMADGTRLDFKVVIIDEFHERGLETDLLLALLLDRFSGDLVVMSATVDAARIARHIDGEHLQAEGRTFPVDIRYLPKTALLPDARGLEARVEYGIERTWSEPGDFLVFLPGKAEINKVESLLRGRGDLDTLVLHGGLGLEEQSRVFRSGERRRAVLATNVAETSLTIPGIGVVIDSGLVRRTRYFNGRGFLTLVPIANDSAEQRAGRAGRTAPGVCVRLWSPEALLEKRTPPEIHREALSPLVLSAAACGAFTNELPFLDLPKDYQLEEARSELEGLEAIDSRGFITDRGKKIYGLPLDAPHSALLIESEKEGCLSDVIDLVSVLSVGRPLFRPGPRPQDEGDDLRLSGCDVTAHILAVRIGKPSHHLLNSFVLDEAKRNRRRLRAAFGLSGGIDDRRRIDARAVARAALRADPRCAYVARRRRGRVSWGNGGPEIELARESAVFEDKVEAVAVLATVAIGHDYRKTTIYGTCALPVSFSQLEAAGLGLDRLEHSARAGAGLVATVSRVYAARVLSTREIVPTGELARSAIARLFCKGQIFAEDSARAKDRVQVIELVGMLCKCGWFDASEFDGVQLEDVASDDFEQWVVSRLEGLGVESGDDLAMLSGGDFLPKALPSNMQDWLDRKFPRELSLGDAVYQAQFDTARREVCLVLQKGRRKDPPGVATLPAYPGFRVKARHHSKTWILRD